MSESVSVAPHSVITLEMSAFEMGVDSSTFVTEGAMFGCDLASYADNSIGAPSIAFVQPDGTLHPYRLNFKPPETVEKTDNAEKLEAALMSAPMNVDIDDEIIRAVDWHAALFGIPREAFLEIAIKFRYLAGVAIANKCPILLRDDNYPDGVYKVIDPPFRQ